MLAFSWKHVLTASYCRRSLVTVEVTWCVMLESCSRCLVWDKNKRGHNICISAKKLQICIKSLGICLSGFCLKKHTQIKQQTRRAENWRVFVFLLNVYIKWSVWVENVNHRSSQLSSHCCHHVFVVAAARLTTYWLQSSELLCSSINTQSGQRTFFSTSDTELSDEEEETWGRRFRLNLSDDFQVKRHLNL